MKKRLHSPHWIGASCALLLSACAQWPDTAVQTTSPPILTSAQMEEACAGLKRDVGPNPQPNARYNLMDKTWLGGGDSQVDHVLLGWEHLTFFPFKMPTRFAMQRCPNEQSFMVIKAESSASSLMYKIPQPALPWTRLSWQWWIENPNLAARTRERALEDSPVRIILAFDGDKTKLGAEEQQFMARMELLTRKPTPYATLMYSVGGGVDALEVVTPHYSRTVRIKALTSSTDPAHTDQWHHFDRDIAADFERAFGEKPGSLISVAIMGDSDNTRSQSKAYIANLRLWSPAGANP